MSRGGGTPNCSCGNHQPTTLAPVLQTVWEDRWVLQKKPYMSADTWELLERKWAAVDAGEVDEADRYSDLIKRRVKQDKEEHVLEQLETINGNPLLLTLFLHVCISHFKMVGTRLMILLSASLSWILFFHV